jgi:hypothetical protein
MLNTAENPFPGMNPYLEQPELWHQIHNRLIIAIADELTPQIVPQYRVSIEERIYTTVETPLLVGIADVSVTNRSGNVATLSPETISVPTTVKVPMSEEITERYLEIRSVPTKEVICVIEVLSPKNKRNGEGRTTYETKRQKILASATHLVEIDLLRGGEPIPLVDATATSDYRVMVSRGYRRPYADLYAFSLRDPMPIFPIPLKENESEPSVNLQRLINDIYQRTRLDLEIDYSQPVKPKLSSEEIIWVKTILQ